LNGGAVPAIGVHEPAEPAGVEVDAFVDDFPALGGAEFLGRREVRPGSGGPGIYEQGGGRTHDEPTERAHVFLLAIETTATG
jgi:hypothetical protein